MSNFAYFFIPTVTLLEGCLYLGLSIWGLVMTGCSEVTTDILHKPFQFTTDLIYLQDQDCGNQNVTVLGVAEPVTLELNWNEAESIKYRTFVFLILYTVFSVLWIVFSLLMIFSAMKSPKRVIIISWFKVVWLLSIIDVVATGFHGYDIVHTSSASETFYYLGITSNEAELTYLTSYDVYFTTPAIVMTAVSSRAAILWLFNVIGSLYCLSIMRKTLPRRIIPTTAVIVVQEQPTSGVFVKS